MSDLTKDEIKMLRPWTEIAGDQAPHITLAGSMRSLCDMALASIDLRERLAQAEREREAFDMCDRDRLERALRAEARADALAGRVEKLEAALRQYGRHGVSCDGDWVLSGVQQKCTCGLHEALAPSTPERAAAGVPTVMEPPSRT